MTTTTDTQDWRAACDRAARRAKKLGDWVFVLRNPDYPEEGGRYATATSWDMDTFYQGEPDSSILATFGPDGEPE